MKFKDISKVILFIIFYMFIVLLAILTWKIIENLPLLVDQVLTTINTYSKPLILAGIASAITYLIIIVKRKG